jgi:hypothetical protein
MNRSLASASGPSAGPAVAGNKKTRAPGLPDPVSELTADLDLP